MTLTDSVPSFQSTIRMRAPLRLLAAPRASMTPVDELLAMEMIMPLVLSGIDCWQQKTETFWPRNPGFAGSSGASRASAPIAPPAKPGSKVAVIPSAGNRADFRWGIHVVMARLHLIHGRYTSGC